MKTSQLFIVCATLVALAFLTTQCARDENKYLTDKYVAKLNAGEEKK